MLFPTKTWLSSVALSGVLLVGSLPVMTVASQSIVTPSLRVLRVAQVSSGTYAQVVHKELKWEPEKILVENKTEVKQPVVVASTHQSAETSGKQPVQQKAVTVQRPVQVAEVPNVPASRGGSDATGIVSRALSLQGIPYVFGGTSRNGFDCSGFTQYVYSNSGVSLPRTSYSQFGVGSAVSRDQLQPGDLVFFTTYTKGASHVGIYIGGGRFVHASDSGVRTTSLSESYYASRYVGGRRPR
ncbi:MAG: C40 family peptidase [Desulfitobacteriaceae bacterium]